MACWPAAVPGVSASVLPEAELCIDTTMDPLPGLACCCCTTIIEIYSEHHPRRQRTDRSLTDWSFCWRLTSTLLALLVLRRRCCNRIIEESCEAQRHANLTRRENLSPWWPSGFGDFPAATGSDSDLANAGASLRDRVRLVVVERFEANSRFYGGRPSLRYLFMRGRWLGKVGRYRTPYVLTICSSSGINNISSGDGTAPVVLVLMLFAALQRLDRRFKRRHYHSYLACCEVGRLPISSQQRGCVREVRLGTRSVASHQR